MNEYYRTIVNDQIKKGLQDANSASKINHPFLTGKLREIVLHELLEPMLNDNYSTGTGKIVDYSGALSKEIDICIYSKNLHPAIFFSDSERLGIFPFESVLSCIEVKSDFSRKNIQDAYEKFAHLGSSLNMTSGIHDQNGNPHTQIIVNPHYRLFIFQTAIKNYTPELFLNVYKKIDPNWNTDPLISHICLVGKGCFCFTVNGWIHMSYDKSTGIHEEIISFLSTTVQDLPRTEQSRGVPRIGYYLTDTYASDKLVDGKLHIRPWKPGKMIFTLTKLG